MSNYIVRQSKKFQKLVVNYFSQNRIIIKYNQKVILNFKNIYTYRNTMILSKDILSKFYPDSEFVNDYYIIFIMYKIIKYKDGMCYLNLNEKDKIKTILNEIYYKFDTDSIYVLGRKYIDKSSGFINENSLSYLCNVHGLYKKSKLKELTLSKTPTVQKVEDFNKNYRRALRDNLLKLLPNTSKNLYMNTIYNNSIFLDTEYVTDIIDDFSEFPISQNLAMNFMIGLGVVEKDVFKYTNFNINNLSRDMEYKLLNEFIEYVENFSKKHDYTLIVHWSPADKTSLKCIYNYTDLSDRFKKLNIIYIDLMDVVKHTLYSESYSLKYIAQRILNYNYDTDCKNGFDAMLNYIENKENIDDLIAYNKIDTELLYNLIKYITK